jgi:hypothetical protein
MKARPLWRPGPTSTTAATTLRNRCHLATKQAHSPDRLMKHTKESNQKSSIERCAANYFLRRRQDQTTAELASKTDQNAERKARGKQVLAAVPGSARRQD